MSTFLDKNKKKSALAALLLFLRTRKTVTALLLLVALASFLFVSPSNFILSFPGGARVAAGVAWMAGKVGVDTSKWGLAGGKRDYGDLLAAFHAAKEGGGKAGWAAFMRGGEAAEAGRLAAGSSGSLGFVKGNAKDLEAAGGDGANLPKPGSVEGVLNPDDAKNRGEGEGVALSEGDVSGEREGLVKSAFAGGFGGGSGFGAAGGEGGLSGGAFANSNFFGNGSGGGFGSGKSASSGKLGDVVNGGLEGIKGQTAKGVQIQGAAKGQLSASKASQINARTSRGLVGTHTISGQRAFVQLAAGRGRAAISVSPNCTPGSGCPGEFAATNTGAVYDGNTITGDRTDILTAPEIDGISSPNLPDTGMADQYVKDAEKMDADAKKCRELDDKYGPQELAFDKQQQGLSNQFDSMGCGQGGCSKSKARACQRVGDQMKQLCRDSMTVRCAHIHECPLTASNQCSPAECDGAARNKTKVVQMNGKGEGTGQDIRTTTMDQGEESAGCVDSKQNIISARQSAQNAVDEYRGNSCEAMRGDVTLTGKIKYLNTCSGRESQVIKTCQNYAQSLCSSAHTCGSTECSGETDQCVITDLKGIEEFIHK
ncbi:MAG: hypothetical protein PHS14_06725 [Elusimicrobia bacterium]|nr:hypothetical protein [Elusimicrobiota bacterium]